MRLWNPEWYSSTIPHKQVIKAGVHGKNHPTIEIFYKGTCSANATEVGAAADAAFDNTSVPVQIIVVSASANDTNTSAGHVRKVRVIGVSVASLTNFVNGSESPVYSLEELNMNGTSDVTSSRYYLRVLHFYACDWGSGGDEAADAITLEYPANTTILTIAAAANESNGSIIYGCNARYGRTIWVNCGAADAAFNNS
jgi:hypothetical protein